MRYPAVVAVLLAACTSTPQPAAPEVHVPDIASAISRMTVALHGEDHLCTGVWVGSRSILTVAHCIDIGAGLDYSVPGKGDAQEWHPAALYRADLDHDLALFIASGAVPDHLIAHLGPVDPPVGTELFFGGHPVGLFNSFRRGLVSAYRGIHLDKDWKGPWMQVSAPIFLGDSGGGAFDAEGRLVGIAHAVASEVPCVAFFVKRSTIAEFLP